MGFARAAGLAAVLVGDIDRGGVFASFVGTLAVLDPADQALIAGFMVNKFRGEPALLQPGLEMLEKLTGRPIFGVLPFTDGIGVDAEDAIDWALVQSGGPPLGDDVLRVTVVALPRMSNHTDVDALACEPGVVVRFARQAAELAGADLVILPGSRATVARPSLAARAPDRHGSRPPRCARPAGARHLRRLSDARRVHRR